MTTAPTGSLSEEFDSGRFRHVLGHFATGVAVITAVGPAGPAGMVVSSFTSVSLEPPLVAFLPDKSSTSWPEIQAAGSFCVNILGAGQQEVCQQFARKGGDKYSGVSWQPAPSGAPVIDGVVAWIDCDLTQTFESGDHYIAIGQVRQLDAAEGTPLVFFQGGYQRLGEPPTGASDVGPPPMAATVTGGTLAELARLTGYEIDTLTGYARSTEGLVDEIAGGYVRSFHQQCVEITRRSSTAREGLEGLVRAAFGSMADNRVAIMILQNEQPYLSTRAAFSYLEPLQREIDDMWLSMLRRGMAGGEFRGGPDPETAYRFIRDVMFAAARRYGAPRAKDDAARHVADYRKLLLRGLLG